MASVETGNSSKLTDFTHAPSWILRLIVFNWIIWLFILPGVVLIQQQRIDLLYIPLLGLLAIPLVIVLLFMQRIMLYIYYSFYWYFQGCLAAFGIGLGGFSLVMLLAHDAAHKPPLNALRDFKFSSGVFNNVMILAFILLALLGLISMVRLLTPRKKTDMPAQNKSSTKASTS